MDLERYIFLETKGGGKEPVEEISFIPLLMKDSSPGIFLACFAEKHLKGWCFWLTKAGDLQVNTRGVTWKFYFPGSSFCVFPTWNSFPVNDVIGKEEMKGKTPKLAIEKVINSKQFEDESQTSFILKYWWLTVNCLWFTSHSHILVGYAIFQLFHLFSTNIYCLPPPMHTQH